MSNNFKYFKNAQVFDYSNQKVVRYQTENKTDEYEDWRLFVENLENSESDNLKQWAELIRIYCERYETVLKDLQEEISSEKLQTLNQINAKSEKARETLLKTYPCMEIKSQLKDGQIQMTELSYSEKYLAEMGYSIDDFTSILFKEGIPLHVPLDGQGPSWIARIRAEKNLTTDPDGYQTPEIETCLVMKCGFIKKIKMKVHYYMSYEKGVPGFVFVGAIVARQKPSMTIPKPLYGININPEFVDFMVKREKEQSQFLWEYYDLKTEQKYTNLHKVCKVKEIKEIEGQENL